MKNYKTSQVVIIGLGITGLSCVYFFLARGVVPKVVDTRLSPPQIHKLPNIVPCYLGELYDVWILNATLIVVSPGVRLDYPVLIEALKLGIEIIGDIELFVREVNQPIVAITGSNGKSTVTQLVGNIARSAGWRVGVVGNIGIPALTLLNKSYQLYVLELSSFQLETTYSLCAEAATVLNISADHMDRYPGGLNQYCRYKNKIYKNAKICIVNALDPLAQPMFDIFGNHNSIIRNFGVYCSNVESINYCLKYYKGCIWITAYDEYLLNCSKIKINNDTNYINMLVALALSDAIKVPRSISLQELCRFSGLPHRCQLVYKNHGISWINDSKSTNVHATISAINNLTISGTLHLLLGGDSKLADFSLLKHIIRRNGIHIYCFGKDGLLLTTLGINDIVYTKTMVHAMYIIARCIKNKDIVLLSPACSSLDQFKSFKERGCIFTYFARVVHG